VILVHGGMQAAQNLMKLAKALSDAFSVYIPDRRGRGLSGAHGRNHKFGKECDDLDAIISETAAVNVFGLSAGALISLAAAAVSPSIRKLAIYEPPLLVGGTAPLAWLPRFDREMDQGKLGAAMVTAILGTQALESPILKRVPRFLLARLMDFAIKAEKVKEGDIPLREIIPTMHFDALAVKEINEALDGLEEVRAEVLLLGGSKSPAYLKAALDFLEGVLPHVRRVEFRGVGHLAPDDSGKPELVARELRRFFTEPDAIEERAN